jgi:hypothetical protein
MLFHVLQQNDFNRNCIFFKDFLFFIIYISYTNLSSWHDVYVHHTLFIRPSFHKERKYGYEITMLCVCVFYVYLPLSSTLVQFLIFVKLGMSIMLMQATQILYFIISYEH